ncbi:MAG TPA: hypothetical protein VHC90_11035 [Bryobacteraceae bacterium]|nr:hypothetical protein [Bryobacteraceae bacterium]
MARAVQVDREAWVVAPLVKRALSPVEMAARAARVDAVETMVYLVVQVVAVALAGGVVMRGIKADMEVRVALAVMAVTPLNPVVAVALVVTVVAAALPEVEPATVASRALKEASARPVRVERRNGSKWRKAWKRR